MALYGRQHRVTVVANECYETVVGFDAQAFPVFSLVAMRGDYRFVIVLVLYASCQHAGRAASQRKQLWYPQIFRFGKCYLIAGAHYLPFAIRTPTAAMLLSHIASRSIGVRDRFTYHT